MYLILQQEQPEDFVIATGSTTRVREFVRLAFEEAGIEVAFEGTGVHEKGYVVSCSNPDFLLLPGTEVVAVDPKYFRLTEVELLIGDPAKANQKLGWVPKYNLQGLVSEMVAADIELFQREKLLKESGYSIKNQYE
jgi:GDPmannose 4,6-dehydratase